MSEETQRDRRSPDMERLKRDHYATAQQVNENKRRIEHLSFAVFGIPEVPGTGLVNEIPKRFDQVDERLDDTDKALAGIERAMWGFLSAGLLALGVQILIHYT